jgi:two-component system, NarL family, response regulator DegU
MPIRVLLVSDKDAGRQAIRQLLHTQPEIELVGEAADFPQAVQMSNDLKPQVVILDLHLPDEARLSPLEISSLLNSGASRLLVISIWEDEEANVLADKFGTLALLDKKDLANKLIPAILAEPEQLRARTADNS